MSVTTKFLFPILLLVLPFQKTKDKCLIIQLKDNNKSYKITNIGDSRTLYYLILEYPNINEEKKKEKLNPILSTGVEMNPTSTAFNLQNREEIKNLPDTNSQCNCATLNNFNLGMEFKLYVQKEDSWITFDAKKLLVEE